MKKILLIILGLTAFSATASASLSFNDVDENTYYKPAIDWMAQNLIINGYPDGTFRPDTCVNRVELLKMLFKTLDIDIFAYDANLFSDTPEGEWYTQYVIAGRARGTINGYPDGTFKPDQCVNRVEAIKMAILEFNDGEIPDQWGAYSNPYDVAKITDNPWWQPYFVSAMGANSVGTDHFTKFNADWSGMGIDKDFANPTYNFGPGESMTRKEVAEMLYRMRVMQDNDMEYYDGNIKPNNIVTIENLPEHCEDGLYNKGEKGLDCGWTCPNQCEFTEKCGEITEDETWGGNILVSCNIEVTEGNILTIEPGTVIKMKHNRDYKSPDKIFFEVQGSLKAVGTPEKQIWFTSDAQDPINGDWAMLRLIGQTESEIKYAIVEFAQQGINMWKSDAIIGNSIIRWNNWEGMYAESYSTPLIEYNRVYQNGYNGMAMEQFNDIILRYNLFEKSGTHGLHIDASEATVENNILSENGAAGLSLDDISTVTASGNTISGNEITGIMCGEGDNKLTAKNNKIFNQETKIQCPATSIIKNTEGTGIEKIDFDYPDSRNFEIDYTPGDRVKDKYQYIYPDDETRKIIKKIGKGLGLTWSITLEGDDIWTTVVSGEIYKLDQDGNILKQLQAPSPQPWGMAFDGQNLWITDFAEKRTYSLDPETGEELFSFNNPDQERGAKGLTWDGEYLYIMGWTTNLVYKINRTGKLIETIELEEGAGGGLTWDGKNFWAPCSQICKYDKTGKIIGKIYSASEGTWDLAWEPADNKAEGYLWATQRTNENWYDDEKIYKIEIINDSLE